MCKIGEDSAVAVCALCFLYMSGREVSGKLISCPADQKVSEAFAAWIRSLATLRKIVVSVIFLVFAKV